MKNRFATFKLALAVVAALALFAAGVMLGANQYGTPNTLVHVVTVKWKPNSTPQQRDAAIQGVKKMASEIPGIKNVWLKKIKVQPQEYDTVFAMEFESKAALDAYAEHPAHKEWEKVYLAVREESTTHDVSN